MVEVYGKSTCARCLMLTRWLDERRIRFEYKDVGKYPELIEELRLKSGNSSLPQYCYEGHWYYGFDIQRLRQIFKKE